MESRRVGHNLVTKQQCEGCMLGMGETKSSLRIALRGCMACRTKTQDQRGLESDRSTHRMHNDQIVLSKGETESL